MTTHPKVGDRLPNGAQVIAYTKQREGGEGMLAGGVVLAQRADAFDPYITWDFVVNEDGTWATYTGHYFIDFAEAAADYADRGGR